MADGFVGSQVKGLIGMGKVGVNKGLALLRKQEEINKEEYLYNFYSYIHVSQQGKNDMIIHLHGNKSKV